MNQLSVKTVSFLGDELMAAKDEETGKMHVGVSYICKGVGLSEGQTKNEKKRVQEDVVLKQGGRNFILPTAGGNQDTLCIELDFLPLWLAKITITPNMQAEQPEVADKLIQYQLKAKDVLAAAFVKPQQPINTLDFLEYTVKAMRDQQQALSDTNKRIDSIGDIIALDTRSWREDAHRLIIRIAQKQGGNDYIHDVNAEIYKLIDKRGGKALETRLTNKRRRMAEEGVCKSKRDKLNKVDVIAEDKVLIELYIAIVKEMAVKYGVAEKSAQEEHS